MRNRGWIGNTQVVGVPFRDKFESLAKRVIKLAVSLQRLWRLYTEESVNSIRGFIHAYLREESHQGIS